MKLDFRTRVTYVIYTESYSNMGITRDEFLAIARDIRGVIGASPYGINDELVVSLCHDYDIYEFIDDFKYGLDKLIETKIK